ncbi:MAG: DUF2807 domain-containing protein [Paramuribaculum sp.]|nr:DUF2807 domain-containing protein [Paramuribaculum sp.]
MKTKISHLLPALMLFLVFASCARVSSAFSGHNPEEYGQMTTQARPAADIADINIARGVTVVYTQSDTPSIQVEAPENLIDKVITNISGRKLNVTISDQIRNVDFRVIVRVSAPMLTNFDISSGASLQVESLRASSNAVNVDVSSGASAGFSQLIAGAVSVDVSSGASANVSGIEAGSIDAEASSGASLSVSGTATSGKFDASSGATINASRLAVKTANAEASSGASVRCNAQSLTRCKATSGGSIDNK